MTDRQSDGHMGGQNTVSKTIMSPQPEGKDVSQNKHISRVHCAHFYPLTSDTVFRSLCTSNSVRFVQRAGQRYINITRNAIGPKSGQKDCRKF